MKGIWDSTKPTHAALSVVNDMHFGSAQELLAGNNRPEGFLTIDMDECQVVNQQL